MQMSNKTYDVLKWVAMVVIPALVTFYGVVGATFQLPYTEEVMTVAIAFNTMLGTILGISNAKYNKSNQ